MKSNKLIILCGIPFSGKTTLAIELEKNNIGTRIDLDDVKFEMLGHAISDEEIVQDQWDQIYQNMYNRIKKELLKGLNVIHDTGNFTVYERGIVQKIADDLQLKTLTIFLDIPSKIAHQRLLLNREVKTRFDISEKSFWDAVAEMEQPQLKDTVFYFHDQSELPMLMEFLQ